MGGDPERQSKVIISTIANRIGDTSESLSLGILDSLLMGGINSPLYKRLIESNMGFNYAPSSGYSSYLQQSTFGIGLQDVKKEDIPKIEATIKETLEESVEKGFDEKRIESILHQIEISQKHVTSNFGIHVMSGIIHPWIHGANPIESVRFNKWMDKIRADIHSTNGSIFSQKLKEYLLENRRKKVILEMHPDPEYTQKLSSQEKGKLEKIRKELSTEQIEEIINTAKLLKKRQEQEQNVNLLPTLTISDIPKISPNEVSSIAIKNIPDKKSGEDVFSSTSRSGSKLYLCPQPTNGIAYLRFMIAIPELSEELIPYIPLFCSILTQMGTTKHSYRDLAQEIESHTGGISVTTSLEPHYGDIDAVEGYIQIKSLAFERNVDKMLELLKEIILFPTFQDTELLRTYISQRSSSIQETLISDGHSFAKTFSASKFNRYHVYF